GLAIVARLATLMEAPVYVRSRVGHGTVFSFEVPTDKAVRALEMGIVPGAAGDSRGTALPLFEMGTSGGARTLGLETGRIAPGLWADLVALDLGDLSLWPAAAVGGDDLLNAIVYSMVAQSAVRHSWVGGRPLVADGRLANMSLDDVRDVVRDVIS
ncbi:MAG TPA: amidohydrolase family protein, partial [Blastocatellia bacterium]|nr:amidohydrolase family protein [Blastocatellia bacterium]